MPEKWKPESREFLNAKIMSDALWGPAADEDEDEVLRVLGEGVSDDVLNAVDPDSGRSALLWSARNGLAVACARILALDGFTVADVQDTGKTTCLHKACYNGYLDCTVAILASDKFTAFDARDGYGQTALHYAADGQFADCCGALLGCPRLPPAVANAKDSEGKTALHYAAKNGDAASLRAILACPAFTAVGETDSGGATASSEDRVRDEIGRDRSYSL